MQTYKNTPDTILLVTSWMTKCRTWERKKPRYRVAVEKNQPIEDEGLNITKELLSQNVNGYNCVKVN